MKVFNISIVQLQRILAALIAVSFLIGCTENNGVNRYQFQYASKFICITDIPGTSQTSPSVLPGAYETVVNIHNPSDDTVRYRKKIALPSGQISKFIEGQLGPDEATSVNCRQITSSFGIIFIHGAEGFLVVESTGSLDVTAVYTAGDHNGQVKSIDVEQIVERKIKGEPVSEERPDLVVQDINLNTLEVDCPGGAGTCVTKVTFTVANIGTGSAGAFNIKIVADPAQSVVVTQSVPGGLVAGGTATFTITTPPGGNCFDSDCTICITVDSDNTVSESDETNNELCKTKIG